MVQAPRQSNHTVLSLLLGMQLQAGWMDLLQRQLLPLAEGCSSQDPAKLQGRSQLQGGCCVELERPGPRGTAIIVLTVSGCCVQLRGRALRPSGTLCPSGQRP